MATPYLYRASRPSIASLDGSRSTCLFCRRHESSFRRSRKALRVKPDPSFAPSKTETQDHIIFNPPASVPNVYHTPLKFLPKSDPRRRLHSSSASNGTTSLANTTASSLSTTTAASKLAKPIRQPYEKKYHLTQEQVDEIRRLRAEDPRKWTRVRLAEKFECSQFFVSLCCCAPEIKEERDRELAEIKRRWGRQKTEAREDRQIRKSRWGRDA